MEVVFQVYSFYHCWLKPPQWAFTQLFLHPLKKTGEDSFPESEFDKKTNKMSFGDKITALFIIIGFIVFVYMFAFLSP